MIIGLVGKPSSGKSSFFKAATLIDVKITGIPFCTIKPNVGVGYIVIDCACKEFGVSCKAKTGYCKDGKRFVPVRLVDVAGLVPGAHEGRGLGNQFLDDLRQASALIHIVDASGTRDAEGKITSGYDPENDIKFLEKEIDMWFAAVIKKTSQKFGKSTTDIVQTIAEQLSGLEVNRKQVEQTLEKVSITNIEAFATELRKVSKPILIAANKIDLEPAQKNFEILKQKYEKIIPTSAESEIALKKAAEKSLINYIPGDNFTIPDPSKLVAPQINALETIKREVIDKYGFTGVQQCLNKAVFELLNYIAVYPVEDENKFSDKQGNVLPDVHLVPAGTTALELAFRIHTDIGNKFVSAIDARSKRRLGKDHQLKNNDVIKIMTSK